MEKLDFKRSSREAWNLLRKLEPNPTRTKVTPKIKSNTFANRIVEMSRAPIDKKSAREVTISLKIKKSNAENVVRVAEKFSIEELQTAIKSVKLRKAAGLDGIYPEFLKNYGPNTIKWLSNFFTNILHTGRLPNTFKQTKVLAVLKPEKHDDDVKSYRPISFLSTRFKFLEILIYNRISVEIDKIITQEQAGYRSHRNCCDQVMVLTTYIENGYNNKQKSIRNYSTVETN